VFPTRTVTSSLFVVCLFAFAFPTGARPTPVPVEAIWRVQQVEMTLHSGKIYYSCEALRAKIAAILTEIGARRDVNVRLSCQGYGLTNDAVALITVASPIEATEENVRKTTTYSTEMQLVARLNRLVLPTANDIDRFPAEWRSIALSRKRRLHIDASDCALLHALTTQVFPQLNVRVEKRFSCAEGLTARPRPNLHVAALVPADAPSVVLADR
jgi:hypothetical protein